MKQVCLKKCQIRVGGMAVTLSKGQVVEYAEEHKYLQPLDKVEETLDFTTATKETLLEAKWKFEDADEAMNTTFNKKLVREQGTKKSEVVDQIMDIRFRAIDFDPNTVVE